MLGPRRHRPGGLPPRDGGQGHPVQAVRRRGRGADRAWTAPDVDEIVETVVRLAPVLRRRQPGGHLARPAASRSSAAPGAPRHPGLPRRPARHRRRDAGRAAQRGQAHRPALGDLRAVISGAGAAGVAIAKILLEAGIGDVAVADRKGIVLRGPRATSRRSSASSPAITNKGRLHRLAGGRAGGRRRLHRRLRRHGAGGGGGHDGEGRVRLRDGQPEPRGPPGRRAQVRGGRRHRAQRLPEPDQQRAGLPGHLRGRPAGAGLRGSPRA